MKTHPPGLLTCAAADTEENGWRELAKMGVVKPPKESSSGRRSSGWVLVAFALGVALGLLLAMPGRYVVINAESPIKLDRWTGETWVKDKYSNGWRAIEER
jgi:hypothetical protein